MACPSGRPRMLTAIGRPSISPLARTSAVGAEAGCLTTAVTARRSSTLPAASMRPERAFKVMSGSLRGPSAWRSASSAPSEPVPSTARFGTESRASSAIVSAVKLPRADRLAAAPSSSASKRGPGSAARSARRGAGPSSASACGVPVPSSSGLTWRATDGSAKVPPIRAFAFTERQCTASGTKGRNRSASGSSRLTSKAMASVDRFAWPLAERVAAGARSSSRSTVTRRFLSRSARSENATSSASGATSGGNSARSRAVPSRAAPAAPSGEARTVPATERARSGPRLALRSSAAPDAGPSRERSSASGWPGCPSKVGTRPSGPSRTEAFACSRSSAGERRRSSVAWPSASSRRTSSEACSVPSPRCASADTAKAACVPITGAPISTRRTVNRSSATATGRLGRRGNTPSEGGCGAGGGVSEGKGGRLISILLRLDRLDPQDAPEQGRVVQREARLLDREPHAVGVRHRDTRRAHRRRQRPVQALDRQSGHLRRGERRQARLAALGVRPGEHADEGEHRQADQHEQQQKRPTQPSHGQNAWPMPT